MINHIEIASRSRENVTHTLYMDEQGKAVGCTCEFRQYNSFKACKHMQIWNDLQAQEQAAKDADRTAFNYYELSLGV